MAHFADQIDREAGNGSAWAATIEYSRADINSATAGALKHAGRLLANYTHWLVNER